MALILLQVVPRERPVLVLVAKSHIAAVYKMHHGMGLWNPYYVQGIQKLMGEMDAKFLINQTQKFMKTLKLVM